MSIAFFVWIARLPSTFPAVRPDWKAGALAAFAVYSALSLYRLRRKILVRAARESVEADPAKAARFASAAHLFGFMSAESTAICGVLAQLGWHEPPWVYWSFYIAGGALLILYWPTSLTGPLRPGEAIR